ncbi:hypothetical protein [Alkanindiges illinoisensis]|uniref:hypothetical protein n=1 Tax=Alkanindiges illinoisensis TaxID=197183 RepID=UPI00047DA4F9|nr:hypothetical protein [Alkanindiges illinoisensis]
MNNDMADSHTVEEIRQALEKTTLTKTIEPDAYADAAQQFVDEYGTDLHMLLGEEKQDQANDPEIAR